MILIVLLFWISFFLMLLVFVLQWLSRHWEILIMTLSHFHWFFIKFTTECPVLSHKLMAILMLIETVFMIIWEMFHGRIHSFIRRFQPLFKIFLSPLLYFAPLPFKVFSIVSPKPTQIPPALIWPNNLSWFKQISKGLIYQFNCHFLSKINLNPLNCFTNRLS